MLNFIHEIHEHEFHKQCTESHAKSSDDQYLLLNQQICI